MWVNMSTSSATSRREVISEDSNDSCITDHQARRLIDETRLSTLSNSKQHSHRLTLVLRWDGASRLLASRGGSVSTCTQLHDANTLSTTWEVSSVVSLDRSLIIPISSLLYKLNRSLFLVNSLRRWLPFSGIRLLPSIALTRQSQSP